MLSRSYRLALETYLLILCSDSSQLESNSLTDCGVLGNTPSDPEAIDTYQSAES